MDRFFKKIEALSSLSMPQFSIEILDSDSYWSFENGDYKGYESVSALSDTKYFYLVYPYALFLVNKKGEHILTVAIQQTDYRELSLLTKERISDLNEGQKGHLSVPTILIFSSESEQNLGPYEGNMKDDVVFGLLAELAAEKLDFMSDPVKVTLS
ncbi:MAG: hypothetical protein WDA17_05225 [Sphaerochaetaceae bacterium]|jgi:hypothetical protein|nr:hypothetical protein [Candidatus Cloacimonadota bacterium]